MNCKTFLRSDMFGGLSVLAKPIARSNLPYLAAKTINHIRIDQTVSRSVFFASFSSKSPLQAQFKASETESKWQQVWDEQATKASDVNESADATKPHYYGLSMFPYPSGRLHMGHVRVYTISDVLARIHRMRGYNVLHPMGWDAFGLPAENAAIERGVFPADWTRSNIADMRGQLKQLGLSFDWKHEVSTCEPDYYRWTQWIFLQMHKQGLAYQKDAFVNWDPVDQTVLANEQVDETGRSWRSGAVVERRMLRQWFLRMTDYADDLLKSLDELPGWPEQVRDMQRKWIGKSEGVFVDFALENELKLSSSSSSSGLRVFTTRAETLYGVTFLAVANEHPLVQHVLNAENKDSDEKTRTNVKSFIAHTLARSNNQQSDASSSTSPSSSSSEPHLLPGVFLGVYARHPLTGAKVPVFAADYVLDECGTGAVMGVPAHDSRDYKFAQTFDLAVKRVIQPPEAIQAKLSKSGEHCYTGVDGVLIESTDALNGLAPKAARNRMIELLRERKVGDAAASYRLRDWLVSRQRYWGAPIPIIHCAKCGAVPVPEKDLPVELPRQVKFTGRGASPLKSAHEWLNVSCPCCGGAAQRDTDTLDTFVDSSWYFLRYPSASDHTRPFSPEIVNKWMPVPTYVGGIEHAILHLMFARFITRFLHNQGFVKNPEPFAQLLCQGMVCGRTFKQPVTGNYVHPQHVDDSGDKPIDKRSGEVLNVVYEKMSKSKHNGIAPEDMVKEHGADTTRLFILFKAPPQVNLEWDSKQISGQSRWLQRLWTLVKEFVQIRSENPNAGVEKSDAELTKDELKLRKLQHETIDGVQKAIFAADANPANSWQFHIAVAQLMKLSNTLGDFSDRASPVYYQTLRTLFLLLAPMAPHISAECWQLLIQHGPQHSSAASGVISPSSPATSSSVHQMSWPVADRKILTRQLNEDVVVSISISGKFTGTVTLPLNVLESEQTLEVAAKQTDFVKKLIDGKMVKKTIVKTRNKLVNFVLA